MPTRRHLIIAALAVVALASGCASAPAGSPAPRVTTPPVRAAGDAALPGMPPVPDAHNLYADAGANELSATAKLAKPLVYVPHNGSGQVWVIDPATFQVVAKYPGGVQLQHVVPAYDMKTLYATDDLGNKLIPFDPVTGLPGAPIPVIDPYNLYFTPDGKYAISVAEAHQELVWYDPHTWQQKDITPTPDCAGIDHADFSADGRIAVFTCEFAGRVAVVDLASHQVLRMVDMPVRHVHMGPQDIKLAPDGSAYYIADSDGGGVWVLDGQATTVLRFIPTGMGAHGLYLSRDATQLYVTNRMEGSVSVLNAYTGAVETKWQIPGGGSPDMGNVSADGSELWLSGRYNGVVYVLSTKDGSLLAKIPVGNGPHGLCVWPQPGRYSLGHTGITR
ncbi:MAG TPA: YncE family protein [Pseudonocardiaceae bacterium]|nr:YncE family protein [Pseudonocardiaceae bacterium]